MSFPITYIDGYKLDHRRQYPDNTTNVYSNLTPRSSRVPNQDSMVAAGMQYFLKKYIIQEFNDNFFNQDKDKILAKYKRRTDGYLGPNNVGTDHIADLHDLGFMPLVFRAIPEGMPVPLRVPILTVENTNDEFFWLTNYIETLMSNILWLPCTSATTAGIYRKFLNKAASNTGTDPGFVQWQAHDFSFRGMPGIEAAQLSGMGHLMFFTGTDSIPAIDLIEDYYDPGDKYFIAGSVAATEHSVMCAGGQDDELGTYKRLLDLYPGGILSVVSDTWDLWKVITEILPQLKAQIMGREGKLVIRPDSGDPVKIICGDPEAAYDSNANKGVIQLLWELFGGTITKTGHKMLDSHIGCIYGDSITPERGQEILAKLATKGFASGNMVFGIGSYTYQYVTRDTYGTAMKATSAVINGQQINMFKKPVTDNGMKNSATGRLAVVQVSGKLQLIEKASIHQEMASLLRPVFQDGNLLVDESFEVIRNRALSFI